MAVETQGLCERLVSSSLKVVHPLSGYVFPPFHISVQLRLTIDVAVCAGLPVELCGSGHLGVTVQSFVDISLDYDSGRSCPTCYVLLSLGFVIASVSANQTLCSMRRESQDFCRAF
jgi:hypothetical protein